MFKKVFVPLSYFALIFGLAVVALGAYTRLTDAGLGCPDWPGCYGHLGGVGAPEPVKAWTEMIHRYLAFLLVMMITVLCAGCYRYRREINVSWKIPVALIVMIVFQALLGMWTVTLKLWPIVVIAHLLGGMTLVSLLWALNCSLRMNVSSHARPLQLTLRTSTLIGIIIVALQIALGGWVSSNYAGLACIGFPSCNGMLLPNLDFANAFSINTLGANFQGGVLDSSARITIQMMHRLGALITTLYVIFLAHSFWRAHYPRLALWMLLVLGVQVSLGIINVVYLLPLHAAVMHNVGAAVLLLTMIGAWYQVANTREAHYVS